MRLSTYDTQHYVRIEHVHKGPRIALRRRDDPLLTCLCGAKVAPLFLSAKVPREAACCQ